MAVLTADGRCIENVNGVIEEVNASLCATQPDPDPLPPDPVPGQCSVPNIRIGNDEHPCSDGSVGYAGPIGLPPGPRGGAPANHGFQGRNVPDGTSWAIANDDDCPPGGWTISNDHQRFCTMPGVTYNCPLHITGSPIELSGNFTGTITTDVPVLINGECCVSAQCQ